MLARQTGNGHDVRDRRSFVPAPLGHLVAAQRQEIRTTRANAALGATNPETAASLLAEFGENHISWGRDALISFALRNYPRRRRFYPTELAAFPVVRLRSSREVQRWLAQISAQE